MVKCTSSRWYVPSSWSVNFFPRDSLLGCGKDKMTYWSLFAKNWLTEVCLRVLHVSPSYRLADGEYTRRAFSPSAWILHMKVFSQIQLKNHKLSTLRHLPQHNHSKNDPKDPSRRRRKAMVGLKWPQHAGINKEPTQEFTFPIYLPGKSKLESLYLEGIHA